MSAIIDKAKIFSAQKHTGQTDLAGVDYYSGHIMSVYDILDKTYDDFDKDIVLTVGLLHDTIEDTDTTKAEIAAIFGDVVANSVDILTKKPDLDYSDYLNKIKNDKYARVVKIADITHNMDLSRLKSFSSADADRQNKYAKAKAFLMGD